MGNTWNARVGNESVGIGSLSELQAILARTRNAAGQELWLVHSDGRRLCMLRSVAPFLAWTDDGATRRATTRYENR